MLKKILLHPKEINHILPDGTTIVRAVDAALERKLIAKAGLADEWDRIRSLSDIDANLEVFALAAALMPSKNTLQRFKVLSHRIKSQSGGKGRTARIDSDHAPARLQIAVSTLLTPEAPPECAFQQGLGPSYSHIAASLSTNEVSSHARIQAERKCEVLCEIWKIRRTAPGAPQLTAEELV